MGAFLVSWGVSILVLTLIRAYFWCWFGFGSDGKVAMVGEMWVGFA